MMRSRNPVRHPCPLDVHVYEGDQFAMPYAHILDPTIEDGIRVDTLGNPIEYWVYDHSPGDLNIGHINIMAGKWYQADRVIHLFRQERPGQLRGWPRFGPGLEHLEHMRRFSKATLANAENAANKGQFIKTNSSAVVTKRMPHDFMEVEVDRQMTTFLPDGWEPATQADTKHPASTNESYQKSELTYFTRCGNMPYSLAAGTSRDSNFASAKMDIKNTWEPEVLTEQSMVDVIAMAPIFTWFLEEIFFVKESDAPDAVYVLENAPALSDIEYRFIFPPLPVSDEKDSADAMSVRISGGVSTFSTEAHQLGLDDDDLCIQAAHDNGVTVQQFRQTRFAKVFGLTTPLGPTTAPPPTPVADSEAAQPAQQLQPSRQEVAV